MARGCQRRNDATESCVAGPSTESSATSLSGSFASSFVEQNLGMGVNDSLFAWLTSSDECLWGGLSCYPSNTPNAGRINVVEFENNGIGGTLPAEMGRLSKMRFFALERGSLTGPIPDSFGDLRSLLLLDFDFNQLSGELPDSLWTLTNLRQLDLNDNQIEGELSGDIGNLKQLRFFQIDNNKIEGPIPSELGDIPNFSLIGLSGNDFTGAMPEEVCDLRPSPLQTLVVDCDIDCEVPLCCTSCVPVTRA